MRTERAEVRQPEAFLRRTVKWLCLDQLKSARHQRETYVGPWLPEPLVEEDEDYLGLRMRTLVTERYRLTIYSGQPYGELFDLQEDPHEYHNLWPGAGAARLKDELRLALLDRLMETDLALPRQSSRA